MPSPLGIAAPHFQSGTISRMFSNAIREVAIMNLYVGLNTSQFGTGIALLVIAFLFLVVCLA